VQHLGQIAPKETVTLLNDSLQRLNDHPATSVVMTIVGFVIARPGQPGVVSATWWAAQWPVLFVGLLAAFAALLYLGPDVDEGHLQPTRSSTASR